MQRHRPPGQLQPHRNAANDRLRHNTQPLDESVHDDFPPPVCRTHRHIHRHHERDQHKREQPVAELDCLVHRRRRPLHRHQRPLLTVRPGGAAQTRAGYPNNRPGDGDAALRYEK